MTHIQVIILIIVSAGFLGGLTNFFILFDLKYKSKECWISFFKSILMGLCASMAVPLFLHIIQTNLLEIQKDVPFPDKNYFVLFGFCIIASVYSKAFLENLKKKVDGLDSKVNKIEQKADEATDKAKENEKEIKNTQAGLFNNEESNAIKKNREDISKNTIIGSDNIRKGYIDKQHTMLAVATGTTHNDNFKYNIYYDPASRSHNYDFKFLGLYTNWGIRGVGEVTKIVYCDYDEDEDLLFPTRNEDVFNNLTKDELKRIKDVIINTEYYELETGQKFFLVDKFYETEYILDAPIMGKQYFWLNEFPGFNENMTAQDIAIMLSDLNNRQL
jgi:hypothetical protein